MAKCSPCRRRGSARLTFELPIRAAFSPPRSTPGTAARHLGCFGCALPSIPPPRTPGPSPFLLPSIALRRRGRNAALGRPGQDLLEHGVRSSHVPGRASACPRPGRSRSAVRRRWSFVGLFRRRSAAHTSSALPWSRAVRMRWLKNGTGRRSTRGCSRFGRTRQPGPSVQPVAARKAWLTCSSDNTSGFTPARADALSVSKSIRPPPPWH